MRDATKLLALISLMGGAFYLWETFHHDNLTFPGSEIIFDRSYYNLRKTYQLSNASFEDINSWYDDKLLHDSRENTQNPQEANVACSKKTWTESHRKISVTVCNHIEHRTISIETLSL